MSGLREGSKNLIASKLTVLLALLLRPCLDEFRILENQFLPLVSEIWILRKTDKKN
jgi:hypothetical protein